MSMKEEYTAIDMSTAAADGFRDGQRAAHDHSAQSIGMVGALVTALDGLLSITQDSTGVAGYHLNGNVAEWDEFPEVDTARGVLSLYRERADKPCFFGIDLAQGALDAGPWRDAIIDQGWTPPGQQQASDKVPCKTHPDAPHGFCRNSSHTEGRYVCECEHWEEPQASADDSRKLSDLGNELHNLSCHVVHVNEGWAEQIGKIACELWKWPQASAAQSAPAGERETIRAVFLRNGFTVKDGQTDLKPYVYAAAEELLSIARASWQRTQSAGVPEGWREFLQELANDAPPEGVFVAMTSTMAISLKARRLLDAEKLGESMAERNALRAELESYRKDPSYDIACKTIRELRAELAAVKGREPVYMMRRLDQEAWYVTTFQTYNHVMSGKSPQHEAAKLYAHPPASPDVEGLVKNADRYEWLRDHYHGFEHYRKSTGTVANLDREIDEQIAALSAWRQSHP